ncbi:MAG: hypothetical protein WDM78_03625 [Puia sp.]
MVKLHLLPVRIWPESPLFSDHWGVNTVLALIGAPVCARQMSLSEVKLISSMRVADNLAENTSTFYAELKKIQYIIESVNKKEKVFILLDEVIARNELDRPS